MSQRSLGGGRTWWAHLASTRINITPIILRKKIEDLRVFRALSSLGDARPSRIPARYFVSLELPTAVRRALAA
jgi:hypothetical protein